MHTVLNYFDAAQNGFISASRYHPNNDDPLKSVLNTKLLLILISIYY
jgi:uracil phosphoribosyltransferase